MAASPPPSAVGVTNLIDDVFPGSGSSSLVLNQDGNPVIAYVDNVDDTLQSRLYKIAVAMMPIALHHRRSIRLLPAPLVICSR